MKAGRMDGACSRKAIAYQQGRVSMTDLDKQVAEALGYYWLPFSWRDSRGIKVSESELCWSTNWQQAGELLERFNIELIRCNDISHIQDHWKAKSANIVNSNFYGYGKTPQEAICKAIIALKESNHD